MASKSSESGSRITGRQERPRVGTQRVSAEDIRRLLKAGDPAGGMTAPIVAEQETGSTNDLLREMVTQDPTLPQGTMVVAAAQTKGRGRLGRSFFSPPGTGVYLSILLRPGGDAAGGAFDAGKITTAAAVAAAEAIRECGGRDVGIKWVNDVYVGGRKVCGILAEAITNPKTGRIDSVVLGIGLNLFDPVGGFPDDIKDRAGSILGRPRTEDAGDSEMPDRLAACVYRQFFGLYGRADEEIAARYRELCFVPGRKVTVIRSGAERPAEAISLDEHCRLLVRYEDDGTEESLFSGEISLRIES